jgi:hypothetical protein
MSEKHSKASKERWAKIKPEDRKKIMSKRINSRWANATPEDRAKQAQLMLAGRNKKKLHG